MKNTNVVLAVLLAGTILFAIVLLISVTPFLFSEDQVGELPDGYEIYTERCIEDMRDSVVICTALEEDDNRTIPVPFDEIEISYFILSGSNNVSILIRDESRSGVWEISFYPDDDSRADISWTSKEIVVGETIFLPSGERVTLLHLDEKGNPQFSVVAE